MTRTPTAPTGDPHLPLRCTLTFETADSLRELVGELGQHLKIVSKALGVKVQQRGQELNVAGQDGSVDLAATVLEQLHALVLTGYPLRGVDVDQACRLIRSDPAANLMALYTDTIHIGSGSKRIHPRSVRQQQYVQQMRDYELVFGIGPAGTGKTYLAMAMAISALFRNQVRRIILCRPAVEAGEKLGFLPGDLAEKVDPYLRPLFDALYDLVDRDRAMRLVQKGIVEVAPLAFMRGRTLSHAFVILDEAQNTTRAQMKMFLTRIGMESRAVVTGDITQVDLPSGTGSGLVHALSVLRGIDEIAVTRFTEVDVVRHPLVSTIVRAYEQDDAANAAREAARRLGSQSPVADEPTGGASSAAEPPAVPEPSPPPPAAGVPDGQEPA